MRKTVSEIVLILLLIDILALAFNIQPVKASGTIYIRADGTIDPLTAPISTIDKVTYTFNDNIYDEIVVERSNIVVDGAGYTLQGNGSGMGFHLSAMENVTIIRTSIEMFGYGIYLYFSNNNRICDNNLTNNEYGIWLFGSSENKVFRNNITDNRWGIDLIRSSNNIFRSNSMSVNKYNFYVSSDSSSLYYFLNDVDDSNTVNSKPVYYWINKTDAEIPPDAGYIALINSTRINVRNLNLSENGQGILMVSTIDSIVTQNNITNNYEGICLWISSNNMIYENSIAYNERGIELDFSPYNSVYGNNIIANNGYGIYLRGNYHGRSSCNSISRNTIVGNGYGIGLEYFSETNTIFENNITNNYDGIELYYESNYNNFTRNSILANKQYGISLIISYQNNLSENNITNSECGIWFSGSWHNSIYGNKVANNQNGIYLSSSSNNIICHNNFNNTHQVYSEYSTNTWDNGYPSGGNYWSDYDGLDSFFGPYQNLTGSDGIGDTPYIIDNYPLMSPYEYWSHPILGDVNKDMKVSMSDITQLCDGFGSVNGSEGYYWHTPPCVVCPHFFNLDIDKNGQIDMGDIIIACDHFGETYP